MSESSNTPRGTPSEVGGTRSTSTHRDKDDTKVAKPYLYYGDRQGLNDWIFQMN